MRAKILRRALDYVAAKPSPSSIPMSGRDRLAKRDYISAFFTEVEGEGRFLFQRLEEDVAHGFWWDSSDAERADKVFSLTQLVELEAEFIQYRSEAQITYRSAAEFVIYQLLNLSALSLRWARFNEWRLGRRVLVRSDRIAVLRHLVVRFHNSEEDEFLVDSDVVSTETLMSEIYGQTWWYAKSAAAHHKYYRLLLNSMVESGDVIQQQGYKIAPKALQTLADFEQQDRRHREGIRTQRGIVWLTIVLALVGICQVAIAALDYFSPNR